LPTKVVAGKLQTKVWYTVKRSGVHVSAPVVQAVEIVRESARGRKDVASLRLDGANATVKRGLVKILEHFAQKTVMMMVMISLLKFALAVIIALDASKRWWTKKVVLGNPSTKVWFTAKRSMASVLLETIKYDWISVKRNMAFVHIKPFVLSLVELLVFKFVIT